MRTKVLMLHVACIIKSTVESDRACWRNMWGAKHAGFGRLGHSAMRSTA